MTASAHDYRSILAGISRQLWPVLEGSPQGVYIYLDQDHRICNQRFAEMLGYESASDWSRSQPFTDYVAEDSQPSLVATYRRALQEQVAGVIDVVWKRRDGGTQPSTVQFIPIAFGDKLLTLHFVTPH